LVDLDRTVASARRRVEVGPTPTRQGLTLRLPERARRGYGLRARLEGGASTAAASSAVEALADPWQSPRHAAVTDFIDPDDTARAIDGLRDWHVSVAQHYDWMWRHYRYRPPDGAVSFTDALGRRVSHEAVRAGIDAGRGAGIASLAYGSVYGAELEYVERYPDERVFDEAGRPLSLGETFYINDIRPGSRWRQRLLDEYTAAIDHFGFDGIHMDSYGPPHHAVAADGSPIDFAALYPGLISEAAQRVTATRAGARVLFNCVDGFPLESIAPALAAALYVELWPPHRAFGDVVGWIDRARAVARGRQVLIAAYAAAMREKPTGPARRHAIEATFLLGSVIAAAGAYHHTLAEGDRLLVEGYYPAAVVMRAAEIRELQALWRFTARYVHLLTDPGSSVVDPGGLAIIDADGASVRWSAVPDAGAAWVRAVRTPDGRRLLHLVDLRDQTDDHWDEPKRPARRTSGLRLRWAGLERAVAVSPWSRAGDALPLRVGPDRRVTLPAFRRWLMLVER
jgi:dextranase